MTLFCSTGWVKLGGSPGSAFESVSARQTQFLSTTKQAGAFVGEKENHSKGFPPKAHGAKSKG